MYWSLLCCLLNAAPAAQPPSPRLAVIREAPDFALINQDGKPVRLFDFKGKVLLVSFIFTTCNGSCPATTHRMVNIQQTLKSASGPQPEVEFISITLDPQRDTPEVLKQYVRLFDLQTMSPGFGWTFVTGQPGTVTKVIEAWDMWVKPAPNGQLDHPSRIFLVDRRLRIREIYNVDLLRPESVTVDIRELAQEK